MTGDVITFPLPERPRTETTAYGCSLPCLTALEYSAEVCDGCPYSEPEPPEPEAA